MGLIQKPRTSLFFTANPNSSISVDNTIGPTNPYNFEKNNPFSLVCKFNFPDHLTPQYSRIMGKYASGFGYYVQLERVGNLYRINCGVAANNAFYATSGNTILTPKADYIMIAAFTGDNTTNYFRHHLYNGKGELLLRQALNTALPSLSIKNNSISFSCAGGMKFMAGQFIVLNNSPSNAEADELAACIAADSVEEYSAYDTNVLGYWREFAGTKAFNKKDSFYDGTLVNLVV
jgi:hypothetical protein